MRHHLAKENVMADIQADALLKAAGRHSDVSGIEPENIQTISLHPSCITYKVGDFWVRVLKQTPKNPDFTPLHRDALVTGMIDYFNRSTVDYSLHVPLSRIVHVSSGDDAIEVPYLISKAIEGESLLVSLRNNGPLVGDEVATLGRLIGRYTARCHSLQAKGAGLMTKLKTGVHPGPWQKYFLVLANAQWARLRESGMVDSGLIDRLAKLTNAHSPLMVGETVNLVHNDLNPASIWIDRTKKKVTGLVNFTSAGVGVSTVDLATHYLQMPDETLWQAMKDGYEEIRSMPDKFSQRLAYYGFPFAMMSAWFYFMRKDEANMGYFLSRGLKMAAELDGSFNSDAARWGGNSRPTY
jgi:hypothetical protein